MGSVQPYWLTTKIQQISALSKVVFFNFLTEGNTVFGNDVVNFPSNFLKG